MNTIQKKRTIWKKLAKSKAYRDAYAAATFKRWLPFQIRVMRERRGWKQGELGECSGLEQGVISRAENPNYGNLTINTILKIAAGFDCAFEGRFVPFSRLASTVADRSEGAANVPSFTDEMNSRAAIDRNIITVDAPQAKSSPSTFEPSPETFFFLTVIDDARTAKAEQEARDKTS